MTVLLVKVTRAYHCWRKSRAVSVGFCFSVVWQPLSGLGQEAELTLRNPEEHERVDGFIGNLRECKDSVAYFDLTLESLLTRVILPEKDQPIFVNMMKEKLGLTSAKEPIASHL